MKSLLFKSAWNIKRINNVSFSEALSMAWKAFKSGVKIIVNTTWNKKQMIAFEKGNCQSGSIQGAIEAFERYVKPSMSGAAICYDGKTFNND